MCEYLVGAKQMISEALALEPDFAGGWHNLGIALKRLGCFEALACHDRALALAPGFAEAHASRGIVLCDLGRFEEALARAVAAISLAQIT
jgi:Flp pilus assembly protein TadD